MLEAAFIFAAVAIGRDLRPFVQVDVQLPPTVPEESGASALLGELKTPVFTKTSTGPGSTSRDNSPKIQVRDNC